jgi:hypothetical protein
VTDDEGEDCEAVEEGGSEGDWVAVIASSSMLDWEGAAAFAVCVVKAETLDSEVPVTTDDA